MPNKNHYQVLGITSDVSSEEIKRAYKKLAKLQHPDARNHGATIAERDEATEEMIRINEAYSTLIDAGKRAEYDYQIGLGQKILSPGAKVKFKERTFTSLDEEIHREKYLRSIFHPTRQSISKLLGSYNKQLKELSADPYDDELLENFQEYVDKIEKALRKGSNLFTQNPAPASLDAAVQMMRYSIAQAADGLEELHYFCGNFDYNHLTMAENLFRISSDLSKQSLALTKA